MKDLYYLAQGKIFRVTNQQKTQLPSEAVEKYRRNIREINKNKAWKTSGTGAMFMGVYDELEADQHTYAQVESFLVLDAQNLLYAANLENSCGIYLRDLPEAEAADRFILRRNDTNIFNIDYQPTSKKIIASVSDGGIEKHLALCSSDSTTYHIITEGESVDIHPHFSRQNPDLVYFSSAGIYYNPHKGTAHFSNYALSTLDLASGEITEILSDETYDYLHPKEDPSGRLHCLRIKKGPAKNKGTRIIDILLAPIRLLKAIFNWLNFFSQRYSGEPLTKQTSGHNPAKSQAKSAEEIFIADNLINAEQALKENSQQGEKYPGIAPRSWELMARQADGSFASVKKGLIDYSFDNQGQLIYSNGRYIIRRQADGTEEVLSEANIAVNLCLR